jgi:DNA segregation ATPase FtsK/SpoIIIE-like protein
MKTATIEINSEQLLGKILANAIRKEPTKLQLKLNDKEGNNNRPDFKSFDGVSLWINDNEEKQLPF